MRPINLSRSPAILSRSSSVRSPHHLLTSPRSCFHFPFKISAFIFISSHLWCSDSSCRPLCTLLSLEEGEQYVCQTSPMTGVPPQRQRHNRAQLLGHLR